MSQSKLFEQIGKASVTPRLKTNSLHGFSSLTQICFNFDMVKIVDISGKGRGLSISEAVSQGFVLLSSSPFVYVLSKTQKGLRCDHCLKRFVDSHSI